MKFDEDLAREILIKVEDSPEADGSHPIVIEIEGQDPRIISYHVNMLDQSNLIQAWAAPDDDGGSDWKPVSLTHDGHVFLKTYRNDTFWQKAKSHLMAIGKAISLESLKQALPWVMKQISEG